MTEFVALRLKICEYRNLDKNLEDNCWNSTKMCEQMLFENEKH